MKILNVGGDVEKECEGGLYYLLYGLSLLHKRKFIVREYEYKALGTETINQ